MSFDELLVRAALEPELCARIVADPRGAAVGFDLTEDEIEALVARDGRLVARVGQALRARGEGASTDAAPPPPAPMRLPAVRVVLTIQPFAATLPDGRIQLCYTAGLEPLPATPASPRAIVPEPAKPLDPWGFDPRAPGVDEAVAAVRSAPPEERIARLLDLAARVGAR